MLLISPLDRRSPFRSRIAACAFAFGCLAGITVEGANAATEAPASIAPLPAVAAFADAHHVALGRLAAPAAEHAACPGDGVTFLVSLRQPGAEQQWLVDLQLADLTDAERAIKPPDDFFVTPDNGGPSVRFSWQHRVALQIATTGPFSARRSDPPPSTRRARILQSADFLGLGLDQACRLILDLTARYGPSPKTKPRLSPEENRVGAGIVPTLEAFFFAAQNTPGLREILWDIAVKPSVWSVVRRGGRVDSALNLDVPRPLSAEFRPAGAAGKVFFLPLTVRLNDRPALVGALIVTAPRPPLLTCAGIIGIDAAPPGDPQKHLSIRLAASRRAAATPE